MREKRREKGALTAEAALLLTVLLSVFIVFLHLFQIVYTETELTIAASKAVNQTADVGYLLKNLDEYLDAVMEAEPEDAEREQIAGWSAILQGKQQLMSAAEELISGVSSEVWFRETVRRNLSSTEIVNKVIVGGYEGISFVGSDAYAEDEMTVICMQYRVEFPVLQTVLPELHFQKKVLMRSFAGEGTLEAARPEQENTATTEATVEEGYVYVTETGTVYHRDSACSYIRIQVEETSYAQIETERNRYGSKYYPCESCKAATGNEGSVWITESGTRYHSSASCSRLKRTVTKLAEREAGAYRPCSRCGQEH
ncbi:MAG: hypothetical protein IJY09_02780 [Lachnospiraceae bacterium]|nr:hypothetical protein [Lachnospiraceae bacterium]